MAFTLRLNQEEQLALQEIKCSLGASTNSRAIRTMLTDYLSIKTELTALRHDFEKQSLKLANARDAMRALISDEE